MCSNPTEGKHCFLHYTLFYSEIWKNVFKTNIKFFYKLLKIIKRFQKEYLCLLFEIYNFSYTGIKTLFNYPKTLNMLKNVENFNKIVKY